MRCLLPLVAATIVAMPGSLAFTQYYHYHHFHSSIPSTFRYQKDDNSLVFPLRQSCSHLSLSRSHHHRHRHQLLLPPLTTKQSSTSGDDTRKVGIIQNAKDKFRARPGTYLLIPCIAALVGWFTNYLAVQMIFYPISYWGIPLWVRPEVPLGLIGWQGIVPCKTKTMSIVMVEMVTSQLLTVQEAFNRLNPKVVAKLLTPRVPILGMEVINDIAAPILPPFLSSPVPTMIWNGLNEVQQSILHHNTVGFLTNLVKDMQRNIDTVFSLENCVVSQMIQDRAKLGELFRSCGQKELDFLTNSGLWFGFLLGLIQMAVALVWDNPWSLSIGGGIVGLATNWLALKWIFEPVNPTRFGPFILQGQFLRRQKEVSVEFSKFFATQILSSPRLWASILNDPATSPAFHTLFGQHFSKWVTSISQGLFRYTLEPETMGLVTRKAIEKLPNHLSVIHEYIDKTLGLQETLRVRMEQMTSAKFERVLHPIFEEDELTLIIAGAVLGFAAGLIQQGLETGAIKVPPLPKWFVSACTRGRDQCKAMVQRLRRTLPFRRNKKADGTTATTAADESTTKSDS
jgi:uncharacterized membrane protein YheB (UPF0754 family)